MSAKKIIVPVLVILQTLISVSVSQDLSLNCIKDWSYGHGMCYLVIPSSQSWQASLAYCQRYGAKLAQPAGYKLTEWMSSIVMASDESITRIWIGYNRVGDDSSDNTKGYWSNGQKTTVDVGVWGTRQPDITSGDCAFISNYKWFMESCDSLLPAVCETMPCPEGTFRCDNGNCVGSLNVCNGKDNCGDMSDEKNCASQCTFYQYGTSGQIESPNFGTGDYPTKSLCTWMVQAPAGERVQLQIQNFETEEDVDIVEIFTGGSTISTSTCVARLSGSIPTDYQQLISSNNFLTVRFVSDSSIEKSGFLLSWNTEFMCSFAKLENMRATPGQNGNVLSLSGNENFLQCESECVSSSVCTAYTYNPVDASCYLLTEIPQPQEDSCCSLYVKTCQGQSDFSGLQSFPSFGETLTASSLAHQLSTPFYPLSYPGMEVIWLIEAFGQRMITFKVKDAELCDKDTVTFRNGNSVTSPVIAILSQDNYPELIMSTGNTVTVYMRLLNHLTCRGVLLTYQTGCDFQISGDSGSLFTPGFNTLPYPGIIECSWKLQSASGRSIKLFFSRFDLENEKDYLMIYDGLSDSDIPVHSGNGYTGPTLPSPIVSSSSQLYLKFKPSAIVGKTGMMASFSAGCQSITDDDSVILSLTSNFDYQDEVTVRCETGYRFDPPYTGSNSVSVLCSLGGKWNKELPSCRRAVCGPAAVVNNGYIADSTGVLGGDMVTFACDTGYSMDGPDKTTCQRDGTWEESPTCSASRCKELSETINDGSMTIINGDGQEHNSIASYLCDQRYEIVGSTVIICTNGEWSDNVPSCEATPCASPYVKNGVIAPDRPLYMGDTLLLTCTDGYELDGGPNFACGEDAPSCININECVNNPCDHNCMDTDGSFICSCQEGFKVSESDPMSCLDINECDTYEAYCDHACVNRDGAYHCICNEGYVLYISNGFQNMFIQGYETGHEPWNSFHFNHTCFRIRCSTPPLQIDNGRATTSNANYYYGDRIEYLCNIGFVIAGTYIMTSDSVSCLSTGEWSSEFPKCEAIDCALDVISSPDVTPTGNILFQQYYMLDCHLPSGEVEKRWRQCVYDKETGIYRTQGDVLMCPVANCGIPEQVSNTKPYNPICTKEDCNFLFKCADTHELVGSATNGDDLVSCLSNGRWDFGDLHCVGTQVYVCSDPGTPPDGKQIALSYELGSLVSFTCDRSGFTLSYTEPIQCVFGPLGIKWDHEAAPVCEDTTPPGFINCPISPVTVNLYSPSEYVMPDIYDNVLFWSLEISPVNFRPEHIVPKAMEVVIRAADPKGNTAFCSFDIEIRAETLPDITCVGSRNIIVSSESFSVIIDPVQEFVASFPNDVTSSIASPSSINIDKSSVGQVITATITVADAAMNTASCRSQLTVSAAACQTWSLNDMNANKECIDNLNGNSCIFNCDAGYVFYENPDLLTVVMNCENGGAWNRNVPACQAHHISVYEHSSITEYPVATETSGCITIYKRQLEGSFTTLTANLTDLCSEGSEYLTRIQAPSESGKERFELSYSDGSLYVTTNLEIQSRSGPEHVACAKKLKEAFIIMSDALAPLKQLLASDSCSGSENPAYHSTTIDDFWCGHNQGLDTLFDGTMICVECLQGYHTIDNKNCLPCPMKTYGDGNGACLSCPSDTNSLLTGVTTLSDCYKSCPPGMTSSTGLAPCIECGINHYSSEDGKTCLPCQTNTLTRGRGKGSGDDCLSPCSIGTYSSDGMEPCKSCPKNFYQTNVGNKYCSECKSDQITVLDGAYSLFLCIDGEPDLCNPDPCNGHGACHVVNHDFYCSCEKGYTGQSCSTEMSICDANPCYNYGVCILEQDGQSFRCDCSDSYSGTLCDLLVLNPCEQVDLCKNNGSCYSNGNSYTCFCLSTSGFTGGSCDEPVEEMDPCTESPCASGSTCISFGIIRRICICSTGFTGDDCSGNIDECLSDPCHNDGICEESDPGQFNCRCTEGYSGDFCQRRDYSTVCSPGVCGETSNVCMDNYVANQRLCLCSSGQVYEGDTCVQENNCVENWCYNEGTCLKNPDSQTCICLAGYGGSRCQYDVDNCLVNPCLYDSKCTDAQNDYTCTCSLPQLDGKNCEIDTYNACANLQPCVEGQYTSCIDTLEGYDCVCQTGYYGQNCEQGAVNCNSYPCMHDGICTDLENGAYKCDCNGQWEGPNCEILSYDCTNHDPCNNGTCFSVNTGPVCLCSEGYKGDICEIDYNVCTLTEPCIGAGSSCVMTNGMAVCRCATGYGGPGCDIPDELCTSTYCANGGTCTQNGPLATCTCYLGYTGSRCEDDENNCKDVTCPNNQECIDRFNYYVCRCPAGKFGKTCDKDLNYDFDFVVTSVISCGSSSKRSLPWVLMTDTLSISLWVRYTEPGLSGRIFTLYSLNSIDDASPKSYISLDKDGATFTAQGQSWTARTRNSDIADRFWHHVVITLSLASQRMHLYIDGKESQRVSNIITNQDLPAFADLLIGGKYDSDTSTREKRATSDEGFAGRISRIIIVPRELSFPDEVELLYDDVSTVPTDVISAPVEEALWNGQILVDYSSEVTSEKCFSLNNCYITDITSYPSITSCSGDQLFVGDRVSEPDWVNPTSMDGDAVKYTLLPGTELAWGEYTVGYAVFDDDNNAAVCTFRLINRRESCSALPNPSDGTQQCTPTDDGQRCYLECARKDNLPTGMGPSYFSCGTYGMWDQEVRLALFQYPACANAVRSTENVDLSLTYMLKDSCDSESLQTNLRNAFTEINSNWNRNLCNNIVCSELPVDIDCTSQPRTAKANVVFSFVPKRLTSRSGESKTLEEVLLEEIADNNKFTFDLLQAVPDLLSIEITTSSSCASGSQLIGDYCVECAAGTYYDAVSRVCEFCPINTYQNKMAQTTCKGCSTGKRTPYQGAKSKTECYALCYVGGYRNLKTGNCQPCPVGFYQDKADSFYCEPCNIDVTTNGQGADDVSDCIPYHLTTLTTTSTTAGPGGVGNVGASSGKSLSSEEIAAVVIGIFVFILAVFIILICCCRDRFPCLQKKIVPEDVGQGTPWKFVNRYGETNMKFVSYKLNDIREKRGVKKADKHPIMDAEPITSQEDTGSVATDISVHLPVFMEKLDGKVTKKSLYMNVNQRQDAGAEHGEGKSRKKRKKHTGPPGLLTGQPPTDTSLPPLKGMLPPASAEPKSLRPLPDRLRSGPPSEVSMPVSINLRQSYREVPQKIHGASQPSTSLPARRATSTPREYSYSSELFPPRQSQTSHRIQVDSDEEDLR